ncbi:MAG: PEP-CTERM sorting domain-containing protein [Planctomycetota bacterium]
MKTIFALAAALALTTATTTEAQLVIDEPFVRAWAFGFNDVPISLDIAETGTTTINGFVSDANSSFSFTLANPAMSIVLDIADQGVSVTADVGLGSGDDLTVDDVLFTSSADIFQSSNSVGTGQTMLATDLPAGAYTFSINDGNDYSYSLTINAVPEPSSLALLSLGGLAVLFGRRFECLSIGRQSSKTWFEKD